MLKVCLRCGQFKEHQAHGLCETCYKRMWERGQPAEVCPSCGREKYLIQGLCKTCYNRGHPPRPRPPKPRPESRSRFDEVIEFLEANHFKKTTPRIGVLLRIYRSPNFTVPELRDRLGGDMSGYKVARDVVKFLEAKGFVTQLPWIREEPSEWWDLGHGTRRRLRREACLPHNPVTIPKVYKWAI